MHNTTPTTETGTASFNSLTDIAPDYPLEDNEVLLVTDDDDNSYILIPNSIIPTSPRGPRYAVGVKRVTVLRNDENELTVEPSVHSTNELSISAFTDRIRNETVITRDDYSIPSTTAPKHATLHFDGASRGNPGAAATGHTLDIDREDDIIEHGTFLGERTNNAAEYSALLQGLRNARKNHVTDITIYGDSQLIVKQVRGEYDCNSDNLSGLFRNVQEELEHFDWWAIDHIPRDENNTADGIANDILDQQ